MNENNDMKQSDGFSPRKKDIIAEDRKPVSNSAQLVSHTPTPPKKMWFSVTHIYKVDRHVFKGEHLPLELNGKNGEKITIFQTSEKTGNNPVIKLLTIQSEMMVEISAKRHNEFTEKLKNNQRVNRLNDTPKILDTLKENVVPIEQEIDRLYKLIRWRFDFDCSDINYPKSYSWSLDGQTWNPMDCCPPPSMISVRFVNDITLTKNDIIQELESLLKKDEYEPLHHALLREAKSILYSSPQSAFVIASVALEVGVKHFIANKVPGSAWLVSNLASPDLHKIFSDYVESIEPSFILSADELEEIRKIIGNRNSMVHTGKMKFDNERVLKSTILIEKILKKIDGYLGFSFFS